MMQLKTNFKESVRLKDLYPQDRFINKLKKGYRDGWERIGRSLNEDLDYMCSLPKTGQVYRIAGRLHTASAERGESPAILSGFYLSQKRFSVRGWNQFEWGNDAYYADWLEVGTKFMSGREGLWRTVKRVQPLFVPIFDKQTQLEFN